MKSFLYEQNHYLYLVVNVRNGVTHVISDKNLENGRFVQVLIPPELDDRKSGLAPVFYGSAAPFCLVSSSVLPFWLICNVQWNLKFKIKVLKKNWDCVWNRIIALTISAKWIFRCFDECMCFFGSLRTNICTCQLPTTNCQLDSQTGVYSTTRDRFGTIKIRSPSYWTDNQFRPFQGFDITIYRCNIKYRCASNCDL